MDSLVVGNIVEYGGKEYYLYSIMKGDLCTIVRIRDGSIFNEKNGEIRLNANIVNLPMDKIKWVRDLRNETNRMGETRMKYSIKHSFICDKCRATCNGGCHEKLMALKNGDLTHYQENKDLLGRKQIIHCLGKYCDNPCELQRENYTPFNEEDGIEPLIELIKWMGKKIHTLIEENKVLTSK